MNVRNTQSRTDIIQNETVNGLLISCLLESSAVNTVVPLTSYGNGLGFDASLVQIDVQLKREGKNIDIITTNLGILGQFHTVEKGGQMWRKGLVVQPKAAAKTQVVNRVLFVPFGDHINVTGDEQLLITVTANRGCFGAGVSDVTSEIQVLANQSIGVGSIVPRLEVYPLQAESLKDTVNLGDNITEIQLMSFELDPLKQIFRTASVSSDRLDFNANELELPLRHFMNFDAELGDKLIALAENEHPCYYPQSFKIHKDLEIDSAKITLQLNSVNLQASRNFVVYKTFITSKAMVQKFVDKTTKHDQNNMEKVPLNLNA